MFKVKNILTLVAFSLMQNVMTAQSDNNENAKKNDEQTIGAFLQQKEKVVGHIEVKTTESSELIPTPEEQGFTKFLIEGKIVYKKQVDGIIVEFQPEL